MASTWREIFVKRKITENELPKVLTLLPVHGAVLMPRAQLPIPIFDIDYINTVTSSLKNEGLIGVVQPSISDDKAVSASTLYGAGTLARITEIDEVEDEKMLAVLEGICRFDVIAETTTINGYRRAEVTYDRYLADLTDTTDEINLELDRPKLLKAISRYFKNLDLTPNWQEIDQTSNEKLITSLVMICPFNASEKQALLESPTLSEQSEIMTKLIEFATSQSFNPSKTMH